VDEEDRVGEGPLGSDKGGDALTRPREIGRLLGRSHRRVQRAQALRQRGAETVVKVHDPQEPLQLPVIDANGPPLIPSYRL
jgi:hypothetical protein